MKVTIMQITTTYLDEHRTVLSTWQSENYLIEPNAGCALRNKKTGKLFYSNVCLNSEAKIAYYEDVLLSSLTIY